VETGISVGFSAAVAGADGSVASGVGVAQPLRIIPVIKQVTARIWYLVSIIW
jgi:hypothetical protein